jgi:hypothetical protein
MLQYQKKPKNQKNPDLNKTSMYKSHAKSAHPKGLATHSSL